MKNFLLATPLRCLLVIAGCLLWPIWPSSAALTHRWSFSEASGTNLVDSAGTANGFIAVIGTTTDYLRGPGFVRLAGGTWGEADFIQMPAGLVSGLTNVSIEVWATPRAAQNWSRIFDFGAGTGANQANDFFLSFCIGSSLNQQRMEYGAPATWTFDTALTTLVGSQYHYVATWSKTGGSSGGGLAAWYRDGVLVGSVDTGTNSVKGVNDAVLWLGRSQYSADSNASADYNEVRIYSHALGTNEINFSGANGPDNYIAPPGQAAGFTASTNANSLMLTWTPGLGSTGSIIVMSAGTTTSTQPNYGTNYTGSANFGSGQNLSGSNYVVFAGAGSSVTISNLVPGVQYFATVYSYAGSGATTVYNLADAQTVNFTAPAPVQSVTLQVGSSIFLGGSSKVTVLANYSGGVVVDVSGVATYASSATNVINVSTNGILSALAPGTALITTTFQAKQASNIVTVVNPLTSNLHHRYPFTADASDVAGGANGTLQGGATIANGQLALDGASGYVSLPSGLVATYTNITIEGWVSNTVSATWSRIFDFGSGTLVNMFLTSIAGDSGALRFAITTQGNGAEQRVNGTTALPLNSMQHVVITVNGGVGILYLDGVALATNNAMTLNPSSMGGTTQNYLGKSQYSDPYFSGSMDEFRIYDAALPASLVLSNYLSGPNALPIPPPGTMNDAITLNSGAKALIPVLANDPGPALVPATVQIVTPPVNGTAVVNTNGQIFYTHNGSATFGDAFTYNVQNSSGVTSAVATVSITISSAMRLAAPTLAMPAAPPALNYQVVDAFPGVTFNQPLALQSIPGIAYSNKLFVVERRGYISYIPDVTATNPVRMVMLDMTNQTSYDNSATDGERGLLGLAFHPGFATNGFFYVIYIADGGNPYFEKLARFTANPTNLTVNTNTQVVLWSTTKREFNHNGGDLHFGPDGYLYVGMGDEGAQYNAHTNAQRLDVSMYSGLLRLDVDKRPGNLEPLPPAATVPTLTIPTDANGHAYYSIPADNPFLGVTNLYGVTVDTNHLRGEFYAIGFRHIWRFSIDPVTGEIWVGNVGQDLYESVDLVRKGGNYGWPYYEGTHLTSTNYPTQPTMFVPPASFVLDQPIFQYNHPAVPGTDPAFSGLDVCGSLPYHGAKIPQLTNAYIFGDFDLGGNIWALRRTNGVATVQLLVGQYGESAFGTDPNNGDVLLCNYIQNKIQRLIYTDVANSTFPAKLSDTGIFADLTTLAPNPGIVNYEPIISFWSDYAIKRRWFCIPDLTNQMVFGADTNWAFPAGMVWIKHFDLELTRGVPTTKKRIETRVLYKTTNACYGVSYQWNDAGTEAYLVPDGGTNFYVNVLVNGTNLTQQWEIPSRSSCLACHTPVAGHALSFNTRELNQTTNMNGFSGNQLTLLGQAGYLNTQVPAPQTLPAFAAATDSTRSLEFRVRSYLAENCVQCHQPGGSGAQTWDARASLTLDQTRLINGVPANNAGDPLNLMIVPGDTNHSVLLQHLIANTFSRMPPLATHQLDVNAINLLTTWISTDLTNRQSFAQWQLAWFGSTNALNAQASADPDGDGANNYYEYLTQTSPLTNSPPPWMISIGVNSGTVGVGFQRLANVGFVVETSPNLANWGAWNVPGNKLWFSASNYTDTVTGPWMAGATNSFFRMRLVAP